MDLPKPIRHYHPMPRRVRALLAELESWCNKERGRRAEVARFLAVSPQAVSAWLAEYRKPRPARQPTAEQALAIQEFLKDRRE
jgi:predicted transcriptional regulator